MGVKYSKATEELQQLGVVLMHEHHQHLVENAVRVDFDFGDRWFRKHGVEMPSVAQRMLNLGAYKSNVGGESYFVITVCEEWYITASAEERRREIDKSLCMCGSDTDEDGKVRTFLVPPSCVIWDDHFQRWGMPGKRLRDIASSRFRNLELAFDEETRETSGVGSSGVLSTEDQATQDRLLGHTAEAIDLDGDDEESTETPAVVRSFLDREAAREYGASDADIPIIAAHASRNGVSVVQEDPAKLNGSGRRRSPRAAKAAEQLGESFDGDEQEGQPAGEAAVAA